MAALRPEKNHALFLRAAARVRRAVPDARFLIVGDGPQRGELEALAQSLAISDAVRFLGTRSDVPEVLSLIDVLALSSHIEANPVSILEAMAAEKPVVATRVGSVDKAVHDGRSGYLVSPGSEEELAGRLIELLRDRPRAAAFGRAGRQHVLEHASIPADGRRLRGPAGGHLSAKSGRGKGRAGGSGRHSSSLRRRPGRLTTGGAWLEATGTLG